MFSASYKYTGTRSHRCKQGLEMKNVGTHGNVPSHQVGLPFISVVVKS